MKKTLTFILTIAASMLVCGAQTVTNRYSMKLDANPDGTYSLQRADRYAKLVDLSSVEDLLVPYTYESQNLTGKLYGKTETKEVVYKNHDGYSLVLYVDQAVSDTPTPWVVQLHGGGWARGNAGSGRTLTRYLAQQNHITGVRVEYSLAPQSEDVNVEVSIQDVMDAVKYMQDHAKEYNIDPHAVGFIGTSAGAHLAAVAAMKCPDAKVLVGYSGIYDLTTAAICNKTRDEQRIRYFEGEVGYDKKNRVVPEYDQAILQRCSPLFLVSKKKHIAAQLFCGTADITVEYAQSEAFAEALKHIKGNVVDLQVYPNYDHNLSAKASDKMEEIFFKTAEFVAANIK